MDALNNEKKHELIRRVFPDLRYGGDPDIERYFELRRDRRLADALSVYNGMLRSRYPDDASRVTLLRLYREGDPRYASYQEGLILELADKLAQRIAANIDLIVAPLERADLSNAFTALKAVESVLARFGGDSEAALSQLARYEEFSRILEHRSLLSHRALELVREYDAVARADSPADYDFIARSEAIEQRRRVGEARTSAPASEERYDFVAMSRRHEESRKARESSRSTYFDPSRITFTAEDRSRVEIPASLRRREDKVLVFCAKFWNQVRDPAFDRLVFLYSRKYGGNHYEIFRAVKLGRQRSASDDEILSAVSGILTTSYDYSVSGDLYMQVMWRRLRRRMEARAIEHRLAAPGPESRVRAAHAERRKALSSADSENRVRLSASSGGTASPKAPPPTVRSATRPAARPAARSATRPAARPAAPSAAATPLFATRAPDFALRDASARAEPKSAPRPPADAKASASGRRTVFPPSQAPERRTAPQPSRAPERKTALPPSAAPERRAAPAESAFPERRASFGEAVDRQDLTTRQGAAARQAAAPAVSGPAIGRAGVTLSASKERAAVRPAPAPAAKPGPERGRPAQGTPREPALTKAAKARGSRLLAATPAAPEPVPRIESRGGSISDRIRALSGKAYDVYREIFLEKVRTHIHRHLLAHQTRSHGLFDTAANDAEDQVYSFMAAHYDDPFMDWARSAERGAVESFGFALPSLDPIIETCFKGL